MTTTPERPRSLVDVPASGLVLGADERAAVDRVLTSGMLAQGPEVAAFELEFSAYVERRPCVAVNSGTSALLLGLVALGVGPGDEVIVPSFSFAATANAVVLVGARPVFADIERDHFCLDPDAVRAAVTARTAAVVPVHLYGHPAAMGRLLEITVPRGIAIVEDAAQAHLATSAGRPVGALGDAAAFSFYPTKNMTCGEGGMVVCRDEAVARRVRLLRNQGMERRYANEVVGYNMRMTDVHAAIGRVQLASLTARTHTRRRHAELLTASIRAARPDHVVPPTVAADAGPVWHQYTVRSTDRDRLSAELANRGIPTGIYYPVPIHRLPSYDLRLDLPRTEAAAREVLSLPVHPGLSEAAAQRVADEIVAVAS